jgi:tetratricopeptide (TPR) repeat protein
MMLRRIVFPLVLAGTVWWLQSGCDSGPSPERLRADSVMVAALAANDAGDLPAARTHLLDAIELQRQFGRPENIATMLEALAESYIAVGEVDSARAYLNRAIEARRSLADRAAVRGLTLQTAELYRRTGDDRRAMDTYVETLRLARLFKDREGILEVLRAMLPSYRALDDTDGERLAIAELRENATGAGNVGALATLNLESGMGASLRGDRQQASGELLEAVTNAGRARDSVVLARALGSLGEVAADAGNSHEALQYLADALRVAYALPGERRLTTRLLLEVGNTYVHARDMTSAARFYRAALTYALNSKDRIAEGYAMILLGLCGLESAGGDPVRDARSGLELFEGLGYARGAAFGQAALGKIAERGRQPVQAADRYRRAIGLQEQWLSNPPEQDEYARCEEAFFPEGSTYAYDQLLDVLLRTGDIGDAFWYAERKSRSLYLRMLAGTEPAVKDSGAEAMIETARRLRSHRILAETQYAKLLADGELRIQVVKLARARLETTGTQAAQVRDEVTARWPAFAPLVGIDGVRLADVQRRLGPGATLVRYVPTARSLYAFAVTQADVRLGIAAVRRQQVVAATGELFSLFRSVESEADTIRIDPPGPRMQAEELLQSMADWFVRPIARDLSTGGVVLVTPTPEFPWLPVHALKIGRGKRSKFMAEQYQVQYVPLAGTLLLPPGLPVSVREVAAAGFPGRTKWDVEYELRDIRAFYKEARLYFGKQAAIGALSRETSQLLHVAAQLVVNRRHPENAAIVLSDGKSQTFPDEVPVGHLLALPATPAVVVSNLSPGGTFYHTGIPLLLAFNGTGATVMNGFVPLRKSKKYFNEVFYTNLVNGVSVAGAFRAVQLDMIRTPSYQSPLVWSQFFLWVR